jgi:two-component system, chemotaxis family, sensor kinase CheA
MDEGLPEIFEIFREESLERADHMASTLLAAEADGGDAEAIAQLFRDAHSIKGSAGMFGFDQVGALAGVMEDVLAQSRERGVLSADSIPALLGGADAIRAAVSDDPRRVEPAAAALRALDGADRGTPAAAAPPPEPAAPPPEPAARGNGRPAVSAPIRRPAKTRTLRIRADKVDRLLAGVGETALHDQRLEHLTARDGPVDEALDQELERGQALVTELQDAVLDLRTLPLETVVGGLSRAVRDTAADVGRAVRLELEGTETPLDRSVLDGIGDALVHLLRNAVIHGIEPPDEREALGKPRTGIVRITAEQRGGLVALTCSDDGRGVSADLLARVPPGGSLAELLAVPGFSTASGVSVLAGRGVGLDAVKLHIEELGGVLEVSSKPGSGTTVTLVVPLTLAVVTVLLVERGRQVFGVPLSGVERAVRDAPEHRLHGRRALELDGVTIPLADLARSIGMDAPALRGGGPVVIVVSGSRRAAVECDRLLGDREVVVKSLGPLLTPIAGYLGAAILDDGGIALLLDPAHLVRTQEAAPRVHAATNGGAARPAPKILVVDDQLTVRELERTILEAAGYVVRTAEDGRAALAVLHEEPDVDCVVSDVEMPGMNGLDLLEAIRARPENPAMPVVIVTSRDDDEAVERGAQAGADAWVVKSQFEQEALLETVGRLVGSR